MVLIFLLFLVIWAGILYWFLQARTFYRLGTFLIMSVLTYLSFELMMWSFQLPLGVMMVIGLLPVIGVVYGFRIYDHYRKREKRKNDEKYKRDDITIAGT